MKHLSETLANNATILPENGLADKLKQNRPLIVKLGIDPTRPDLHLGHVVVFNKLREFQKQGHKIVLIIGNFTAQIGDPTGQDKTRPILERDEIALNAATYVSQIGKIIDTQEAKIIWNAKHLGALNFEDILKLVSSFTVSQMMERDDFKGRFNAEKPIGLHEFLYPIAQAFDSLYIEADVEIGGNDQLFNIMMGRDLQKAISNPRQNDPQIGIITPLLVGTDGKLKMSKTYGNHISLTDEPNEMFGKTMSIPDELIWDWWRILFSPEDHGITKEQCEKSPYEFKKLLASEIVREFHGPVEEDAALLHWQQAFSNRQAPDGIMEVDFMQVVDKPLFVVVSEQFNESRTQARRLIEAGAVKFNGEAIRNPEALIPSGETIIKVGKLRFIKVIN